MKGQTDVLNSEKDAEFLSDKLGQQNEAAQDGTVNILVTKLGSSLDKNVLVA